MDFYKHSICLQVQGVCSGLTEGNANFNNFDFDHMPMAQIAMDSRKRNMAAQDEDVRESPIREV